MTNSKKKVLREGAEQKSIIVKNDASGFHHGFNMELLLEEVINHNQFAIEKKNIKIEKKIEKNIKIISDKKVLKLIINNILQNSLKFSYVGGIVHLSAQNYSGATTITIKDSGIGIEQRTIERIFNDSKVYSKVGTLGEAGNGIGLKLCLYFIQKLNGDLIIAPNMGEGTIVKVVFPDKQKKGSI